MGLPLPLLLLVFFCFADIGLVFLSVAGKGNDFLEELGGACPSPRTRGRYRSQGEGASAGSRLRGPAQVPGLKSWVMIGSKWSGGGAACLCKRVETRGLRLKSSAIYDWE